MKASQCAARARLAARALYTVSYGWHQHAPDKFAVASAVRLATEAAAALAALRAALKELEKPQ